MIWRFMKTTSANYWFEVKLGSLWSEIVPLDPIHSSYHVTMTLLACIRHQDYYSTIIYKTFRRCKAPPVVTAFTVITIGRTVYSYTYLIK